MADDDKTPEPAKGDDKPDTDALGEGGKKALDTERKERKAAEKRAKELETRLKEIEDKDKSEVDKLREELATEKKAREDADLRAMRMEVALEKGLDDDSAKRLVSQAKRLQGGTREELEADADDFFSSIKPADDKKDAPTGKPKERLSGGGDPTEEPEADIRKVVDAIPRSY